MRIVIGICEPLIRSGLKSLLRSHWPDADLSLAINAADLLRQVDQKESALAIVSLRLGGLHSIDNLRELRFRCPQVRLVVFMDGESRSAILQCLEVGINGVLLHSDGTDELLRGLDLVVANHLHVPDILARPANEEEPEVIRWPGHDLRFGLTQRQADVIRLVQKGYSNKQIARELGLGLGTVKVHLAKAFEALGARSRFEVITLTGASGAARTKFVN